MKIKSHFISVCSFLFYFQQLFSQGHLVSGTIVDENGTPLPGVTVVEENTANGVVSNLDGNYVLTTRSPWLFLENGLSRSKYKNSRSN